jgi:hypothetical protein
MTPEEYADFAKAIHSAGFYTNGLEDMDGWNRTTVCSKKNSGGGYSGNSFWVTRFQGGWHLGTWGGMVYRLPAGERIVELCATWLNRAPGDTRSDFDDGLKSEFGLIDVTDEDDSHPAIPG